MPQSFNYQAIARISTGKEIVNTPLQVKISILSDTTNFYFTGSGTYVWEELHNVTTNAFGLFTLTIGSSKATKVQGSAATFSAINWNVGPLFLGAKILYQGAWLNLGTSKLGSVPYATIAGNLSGPFQKLAVQGAVTSPDSALFEVKNNTGQTVFAVYNEGIRAYVDNGIVKGATKGGFAIGGFGTVKAPSQNLMMISPDSARIYVDETRAKGATKGGFAIGGFNTAKSTSNKFMTLTPSNYFIGHNSGQLIDTSAHYNATLGFETARNLTKGTNNVFIGYQSGLNTTVGSDNVFLGTQAGYKNDSARYNVVIGRMSGYNNKGSSNILIGDLTGYSNTDGDDNVMIGDWAGYSNTVGYRNIFLGAEAGWYNTSGSYNIFQGYEAGLYNKTGSYNSFLGYKSGLTNSKGNYNTMVGFRAGYSSDTVHSQVLAGYLAGQYNTGGWNTMIGSLAGDSCVEGYYNVYLGLAAGMYCSGSNNVFIGRWAGRYEPSNNNYKLIIEDYYEGKDNYNNALIYGDFSSNYLRVNGNFYSTATTTSNDSPAITAQHNVTPYYGYGVKGYGGYMGVRGEASLAGTGTRYGVYGSASGGTTNYGIYGTASTGVAYAGYFSGNVYATGTITQLSDKNFKRNILPLTGSLNKIIELQGVSYEWKSDAEISSLNLRKGEPGKESESQSLNLPRGLQLGLIAQDVENVVPELVQTDGDGLKSVDYIKMIPLLIEAIKEQQQQIETLKSELEQIKALLAKGVVK